MTMRRAFLRLVGETCVGPLVFLLIWAVVARMGWIDTRFVPAPESVAHSVVDGIRHEGMARDIAASLGRTLAATALAVLSGFPVGLLLGGSRVLYRSTGFLIDFFRSIPPVALFPLFMLFLGIGDDAKIALAGFAGSLVVMFNVAYGTRHASKTRILAARSMGASSWQIARGVLFFEAMPHSFAGLRVAVSLCLLVITAAEMFIGAQNGLGHRITDAQLAYDMPGLYAGIVCAGLLGYGLNLLFVWLHRATVHWAGR